VKKKLAELPPGGEKTLNASMQQAIQSDVELCGSQKVNMEPPPDGQKALKASMQQAIKSNVEPPARR
jgi:hypothetical protein